MNGTSVSVILLLIVGLVLAGGVLILLLLTPTQHAGSPQTTYEVNVQPQATSSLKSTVVSSALSWQDARALINAGEIVYIIERDDRTVLLHTTTGVTYEAEEPQLHDAYNVVQACGAPCGGILVEAE